MNEPNHVVFAEPSNQKARDLEADALEQLGFQQENPTWRNEYLMGAYELRHGVMNAGLSVASPDTLRAMPLDMFLNFLGIHINGKRAEGKTITINLNLLDTHQQYAIELENAVLIYTPNKKLPHPDVSLSLNRNTFDALTLGKLSLEDGIKNGSIRIQGDKNKITELFSLMDTFNPAFNIMTSNITS